MGGTCGFLVVFVADGVNTHRRDAHEDNKEANTQWEKAHEHQGAD